MQMLNNLIPNIVHIIMNAMLNNLPSCGGVNRAIFDNNREGAPSPNGILIRGILKLMEDGELFY